MTKYLYVRIVRNKANERDCSRGDTKNGSILDASIVGYNSPSPSSSSQSSAYVPSANTGGNFGGKSEPKSAKRNKTKQSNSSSCSSSVEAASNLAAGGQGAMQSSSNTPTSFSTIQQQAPPNSAQTYSNFSSFYDQNQNIYSANSGAGANEINPNGYSIQNILNFAAQQYASNNPSTASSLKRNPSINL